MRTVVLDFETYWSDTYTLSKMTTEAYVRDERFHAHGVGLVWEDGKREYILHEDIPSRFAQIDWTQTIVIAHHAHFDGAILNWIYGVRPAFWICTLSIARSLWPGSSVALAKITEKLGITHAGSGKGQLNTKNIRHLTPHDAAALGEYCMQDCELTLLLWQRMKPMCVLPELQLIDQVVRMFTEPVLVLNKELLQEAYDEELAAKEAMMSRAESNRQELGSNEALAALLEELGVEPPMKLSPAALKNGEEKLVYAFAKSDEQFAALLEHEDPRVAALVEARLGIKSTLKETRTARLLSIAERGPWPVYYNYYGGHTGRLSGGDKVNPQNFTRGSKIREAVEAPPGYACAVQDLSQIEARVLVCLAGQHNIVEAFAQNRDVYSEMASTIFGRKVDRKKNPDDFIPGFIGKATVLGCGYGLGWKKFQQMIRIGMLGMKGIRFGRDFVDAMGVNISGFQARYGKDVLATKPLAITYDDHLMHCAVAKHIIDTFRNNNPEIVKLWGECGRALPFMLQDDSQMEEYPFVIGREPVLGVGFESIWLPNGMRLAYPHLKCSSKGEYTTMKRKGNKIETSKVYGGLVTENVVQALARIVITDAMTRMREEGMRVVLTTHDEIVVVDSEETIEATFNRMGEIMSIRPDWQPSLPLACEGGWAHNYSK